MFCHHVEGMQSHEPFFVILGYFVHGQLSGSFFYKKYPYCPITTQDIIKTSDGVCDGGILNTIGMLFYSCSCALDEHSVSIYYH